MLGTFQFQSAKHAHLDSVHQGRCIAHMYVMHVAEELDVWPESAERQRHWVSPLIAADVSVSLEPVGDLMPALLLIAVPTVGG